MNPPTLPISDAVRRALALAARFGIAALGAWTARAGDAPRGETGVPSYAVFEPSITGTERGVNSIRLDSLGRLLVATGVDLVAYDGGAWTKYRQEPNGHDNMPIVMDTAIGDDGRLYAGTDYGLFEVEFLPGDRFRLVSAVENIQPDWPSYFYFNRLLPARGAIYVVGIAHLARYDLETRALELLTDRRDYGISHFEPDPADGALYLFNSIGGLWRKSAAEWQLLRPPGDPAAMLIVRSSLTAPDGQIILGTEDSGLVALDGGALAHRPSEIDEIGTPPVISMAAMDDGRMAVSMLGFGVAMLDEEGNFAQVMSRSLDYRFAETTHLLHAGNGVVWAALENSLARIAFMDPLSEYARYAQHALPFPRFDRHAGRMHLIADYRLLGADYFKGGALKGFVERPIPSGEKLNYFLSTPDGLLCATDRQLFLLKDDDSIEPARAHGDTFLIAPIGDGGDTVACVSLTEYFLLRRDGEGRWALSGAPLPASGMSHEIVEAGDGSVWVEHGLGRIARLRLVDGALEARVFGEADGIGNSWINIWSVNGEIYTSKAAGVFLHWDAQAETFDPASGLLVEMATRFSGPMKGAVDPLGNVWVPATAGHGVLWKQADGSFFADRESLRSINDEYIHKMWVGGAGDIWMRGRDFVARYDPAYAAPSPVLEAPNIYCVELLERREFVHDARAPGGAARSLELEYADNSLKFHFTYPLLSHGKRLRYECFLEGISEDWIGVDHDEEIDFSNLAAGSYRFLARSTFDGVEYSPVASIAVTIHPPPFRSPWAYATYALLFVLLIYIIVSRMRRLERRKTLRLQQIVETRTRELDAANLELRIMCDRAEAGNRAKSAFIAMISHEMRTPLNAIIGPSSALHDEFRGGSERHLRMLALIHGSAKHLLSLINDILTFSGKDSKAPSVLARFDLNLLLEELLDAFAPKAEAKGLSLECSRGEDLPHFWEGDATRLRQVVINLLDNAIKCTDEGRVELRVERESESSGQDFLRVTVLDTGIGVVEGDAGKIFDPFVQGNNALSRPHEGTGLGLAICKQLVGQLRGEIGFERPAAGGSAFWFRVPMAVSIEQDEAPREEGWRAGEFASCSALVAEDNAENRFVMEIALSKLGCSFRFTPDGESALRLLQEQSFDVAFIDLRMPGLDGIGVARAVRALDQPCRGMPLIAFSAYLSDEMKGRCAEAGFDDYLDKPVLIADIARALRRALARQAETV